VGPRERRRCERRKLTASNCDGLRFDCPAVQGEAWTTESAWTAKPIENIGLVQVDRVDQGFWQILLDY
jgi:hypothetical protein